MERVTEAAVRRQRTIQTTLLFIILATLPCYCVGFVLLGVAPRRTATPSTPTIVVTTAGIVTASPTPFESITPFPTFSNESALPTLRATPLQFRPPIWTLTFTPTIPTKTP